MSFRVSFLVVAVVSLVVSCGPAAEHPRTSGGVLRLWLPTLEAPTDSIVRSLVASFESRHSCTVEIHLLPSGARSSAIDSMRVPSGADVVVADIASISALADGGFLSAIPSADSVSALFLPGALYALRWKGALVALPWLVDTRVLYAHPDVTGANTLLPPASQEGLLNLSESAVSHDYAAWAAHAEDPGRMIYSILPFLWTYGGDVLGGDTVVTINSPHNAQALSQYVELSRTGRLETERQLNAEFLHGSIGLWFGGSKLMQQFSETGHTAHATAMLFPGNKARIGTSVITGLAIGIARSSTQRDLAHKLVTDFTGTAALQALTASPQSPLPARLSVLQDLRRSASSLRPVACEQLLYARSVPAHPRWSEIARMIEQSVVRVLYGEQQPEEALQRLQADIQELVKS